MRKSAHAIAGFLTYCEHMPIGDFYHTIEIGSDDWWRWIDRGETFSYQVGTDHFSIRGESRARGGIYWSVYRQVDNHIYKGYVGRTADMTHARLLEAIDNLKQKIKEGTEK